jgi:chromosomal replication initiator protein
MAEQTEFVWGDLLGELQQGTRDPYLDQAQGELLVDKATLRIRVTSPWARKTIEDRHLDRIRESLKARYDEPYEVEFLVDSSLDPPERVLVEEVESGHDSPTEIGTPRDAHRETHRKTRPRGVPGVGEQASGLNARYTFDRFVVGSSNRLAFAASLQIAENPDGSRVNPMFIYGGVGLGKTHLLHAIGNLAQAKNPGLRVLYVSAETFTNDMIEAIRRQETSLIRNKYRTMDMLLMDDIQFLQRKEATQIEFFNTFNDLHNANKQIVLASDSSPQDMSQLEERVKSRFMWGMLTSIDSPEVETRTAILHRKAEDMGIVDFPNDVATYMAEHVTSNIRELEGALSTVYQHASLQGRPLTVDFVQEILDPHAGDVEAFLGQPVSVDAIQRVTAEYYHMKPTELKSKRRTKRVATVRHIAMYLCRQLTDLSLVDIGRDFGGRDHSTVINGCVKIEREVNRDPQLADTVKQLTRRIVGQR